MNAITIFLIFLMGTLCLLFLLLLFFVHRQILWLAEYVSMLQHTQTKIEIPTALPTPGIKKLVQSVNELSAAFRENLAQVQKKEDAVKETITNLAHDLRTPLTSIKGYAQILSESSDLPTEAKANLTVILERVEVLNRLLNQLFDYARMESEAFVYHDVSLDLNKLLRMTAVSFYSSFENRGLVPTLEIAEDPFPYVGDPDAVTRVFSNILYNAIEHGNSDYYMMSRRDGDDYLFVFRNDASDVTQEDVAHLFDRFYTTDKSRSKKTTGLGLSIAKKIVTHMNGTIEANLSGRLFEIVIRFPIPD